MRFSRIVIHCLIGSIVTRFTLCPPLSTKYLNKYVGLSICGILSALLFSMELDVGKTLYDDLNLTPKASKPEIDFVYSKFASEKGVDPVTAEKAKYAHSILTDDKSREHYSKYGDLFNDDSTDSIILNAITLAFSRQMIVYSIGYFFTYPKYLRFSRQIFFLYNILAFCLILELRLIKGDGSFSGTQFFDGLLKFQIIELIYSIFPSVFTICCTISCLIFVDEQEEIISMMKGSMSSEKVLLDKISQLESINNSKMEPPHDYSEEIVKDVKNLVETMNDSQKISLERVLKHISGTGRIKLPKTQIRYKSGPIYILLWALLYVFWQSLSH